MRGGFGVARRAGLAWLVAVGMMAGLGSRAWSEGPGKPFPFPKDRAGWEAKREEVRAGVITALGIPDEPDALGTIHGERVGEGDGSSVTIEAGFLTGERSRWSLVPPRGGKPGPFPLVLIMGASAPGDDRDAALALAKVLARRGFATLMAADSAPTASPPWSAGDDFGREVRRGRNALTAAIASTLIDPERVCVLGIGADGVAAWWLMALDERVTCGIAAGGVTRFGDWRASGGALAPWASGMLTRFDSEAVMALCAPRTLSVLCGDRDPLAPVSGYKTLTGLMDKVWALYPNRGQFNHTLYGGLGGGFTPLEQDSLLERLDKAFMPQGPNPLGHEPEPEPKADATWTDPAAHGIAGWVAEMSQRPTSWTWADGVIACKPGRSEYGWLRMPVELDDFEFQAEWRVPKKGNSGIFIRAKSVAWTLPPGDASKLRVATLGLEWPSRTGLELQAQDDPGNADKYSSGSLYRHAAPSRNPTKPAGEWNRYTVRCRGPRVELWVNGEEVLDTRVDRLETLREPPLRGYVGFQNHGSSGEFRNVRYRRLGPVGGAPR